LQVIRLARKAGTPGLPVRVTLKRFTKESPSRFYFPFGPDFDNNRSGRTARVESPMPHIFCETLEKLAREAGLHLDSTFFERCLTHFSELLRWNKAISLSTETDPQSAAIRLYLDSLIPLPQLPENARVLDIGTGGGFPGVVLALARPDLQVAGLESNGKKIHFLRHITRTLALANFLPIHGRLEELDENAKESLGKFSRIITRATFSREEWMTHAGRLLTPGGRLLLMRTTADANRAWPAPWSVAETREYRLPGQQQRFALISLQSPGDCAT